MHESILDPNLFIAPTCPTGACAPNVMPATLSDTLTTDEINAIVTYLSGLPEGAYTESAAADVEVSAPKDPDNSGADIVRDPTDLPGPIGNREPQVVRIDLEATEVIGQLADGTTFTYWTFNNQVPGPFFRVRIFFGVGGPNFTSSFHIIGEIFDRVYDQASLTGTPLTNVQTTLVPPGGATMVEFDLEVPGNYILVDHALSRLQRGLAGYLIVEGDPNPEIYNGIPSSGSGH
ncbi:MAG: hypothetical protein OHK003_11200 [Anaerolineales bacterium]